MENVIQVNMHPMITCYFGRKLRNLHTPVIRWNLVYQLTRSIHWQIIECKHADSWTLLMKLNSGLCCITNHNITYSSSGTRKTMRKQNFALNIFLILLDSIIPTDSCQNLVDRNFVIIISKTTEGGDLRFLPFVS